jgi:hypothetical protein
MRNCPKCGSKDYVTTTGYKKCNQCGEVFMNNNEPYLKDEIGQEVRVGDYVVTNVKTSYKNFMIKKVTKLHKQSVEIHIDELDYYAYAGHNYEQIITRNYFIKASMEQVEAYDKKRKHRAEELGHVWVAHDASMGQGPGIV